MSEYRRKCPSQRSCFPLTVTEPFSILIKPVLTIFTCLAQSIALGSAVTCPLECGWTCSVCVEVRHNSDLAHGHVNDMDICWCSIWIGSECKFICVPERKWTKRSNACAFMHNMRDREKWRFSCVGECVGLEMTAKTEESHHSMPRELTIQPLTWPSGAKPREGASYTLSGGLMTWWMCSYGTQRIPWALSFTHSDIQEQISPVTSVLQDVQLLQMSHFLSHCLF